VLSINTNVRGLHLGLSVLFALAAAAMAIAGLALGSDQWMLMAIGAAAPAALLGPTATMRRNISLLDPINVVLLWVLIGCTAAAWFVAFGEGTRRTILMNQEGVAFFVSGGMWVLMGLLLIGIGNGVASLRLPIERFPLIMRPSFDSRRAWVALLIGALVTIVATWLLLRATGGFSLDDMANLSRKRSVTFQDEMGADVRGTPSYLRLLSGLGYLVVILVVAGMLQARRKLRPLAAAVLAGAVLCSLAAPFFVSSRGAVVLNIALLFPLVAIYRGVKVVHVLAVVATLMVVFSGMTTLRILSQSAEATRLERRDSNPLQDLAASGNGLSLVGTSLIVQRVPQRLDYMMGRSLTTWVTAPIPRSVWHDKPDVALGKIVNERILGAYAGLTARPPGFMGEGHINFGILGFGAFAFVFGCLLRTYWESFRPLLGKSPIVSALYVVALPTVTGLVATNLSQAIVLLASDLIPFVLIAGALTLGARRFRAAPRPFNGGSLRGGVAR
jgi:hypothetical protein